jgi:G3E family GTPase
MPGGCICCTLRQDIEQTLQDLFAARDDGNVPFFNRVVIESTGIASPQPLLRTLYTSPVANSRLEKPYVTVLVDGVMGLQTFRNHPEAADQLAAADSVVISKKDMGFDAELPDLVHRINPFAVLCHLDLLTTPASHIARSLLAEEANTDARCQLLEERLKSCRSHPHHEGIRSACLVLEQPLDWGAFGIWLTMLLHRHGEKVLRVKGLLAVEESLGMVAVQVAQHLVHPPEHLDPAATVDRTSRLMFITRELDPALIERSLRVFDAVARQRTPLSAIKYYLPATAGGTLNGRPIKRPTAPRWLKG